MSSDDGWLLRQNDAGKYVLQRYFLSDDEMPDIEAPSAYHFNTLDEAVRYYSKEEQNSMYPSEYGLSIQVKDRPTVNDLELVDLARKPFGVKAVQITEENIEAVAAWCGGSVHYDDTLGKNYVKVNVQNPLNEKQTRGYPTDWVLFARKSYKVYTDRAKSRNFVAEGGRPNGVESNVFDNPVVDAGTPIKTQTVDG